MILSDSEILVYKDDGQIVIEPFSRDSLGSNSYDVHLSKHLAVYGVEKEWPDYYITAGIPKPLPCYTAVWPLDAKKDNPMVHFEIPEDGLVLLPGVLYLGATEEYTETLQHVPFLDGKSSTGRLGIQVHFTAGKGDVGFKGFWTLEIEVAEPVTVYAGMPIGQIFYHEVRGNVERPYSTKKDAKYHRQGRLPVGSKMWKNFK